MNTLIFYDEMYPLVLKVKVELQHLPVFAFWKRFFLLICNLEFVKKTSDCLFTLGSTALWATCAALVRSRTLTELAMRRAYDNYLVFRCLVFHLAVIVSVAMNLQGISNELFCSELIGSVHSYLGKPRFFECFNARTSHDDFSVSESTLHASSARQVVLGCLSEFAMIWTYDRNLLVGTNIVRLGVIISVAMNRLRLFDKFGSIHSPTSAKGGVGTLLAPLTLQVILSDFFKKAIASLAEDRDRLFCTCVYSARIVVLFAMYGSRFDGKFLSRLIESLFSPIFKSAIGTAIAVVVTSRNLIEGVTALIARYRNFCRVVHIHCLGVIKFATMNFYASAQKFILRKSKILVNHMCHQYKNPYRNHWAVV